MPTRQTFPRPNLPSTHYFITLARGETIRTFAVRTLMLRAAFGVAALLGVWSCVSAAYLGWNTDFQSGLLARQSDLTYAYEDRIADMKGRLERMSSRHLLEQTALEAKVRVLASRENQLEARAALIQSFVGEAKLGPGPRARNALQAISGTFGSSPTPPRTAGVLSFDVGDTSSGLAGTGKPRPVDDAAQTTGSADATTGVARQPGSAMVPLDTSALPAAEQIELTAEHVDRMDAAQRAALASIARSARATVGRFTSVLADAGLSPARFASIAVKPTGEGGPFVPLPESVLGQQDAVDLQANIREAARLRAVLASVPLARPLPAGADITSGFGPRIDPFNGRPALHTGIDFGQPNGAPVRATAPGRVTVAGPEGGYGIMVEIDHGNGLTTRYGHLSAVGVGVGDRVEAGGIVGNVGSTGRATGPHLHYETRIDGEPIDPLRFLRAGEKLFAED